MFRRASRGHRRWSLIAFLLALTFVGHEFLSVQSAVSSANDGAQRLHQHPIDSASGDLHPGAGHLIGHNHETELPAHQRHAMGCGELGSALPRLADDTGPDDCAAPATARHPAHICAAYKYSVQTMPTESPRFRLAMLQALLI